MSSSSSELLQTERNAVEWLDEATPAATRLRAPLSIVVVRPLEEEDLADEYKVREHPPLRELKASHHHLAKLCAEGRSDVEASRITGYSPSYVARMRKDPSFSEMVLGYSKLEELAAVEYLGSMRAAGMDMLDEIRRRLEDDPKGFSITQLQEGVKLLLVEPMKSEALRSGLGGSVAPIQISFVSSSTPQASEEREGTLIEGEVTR